MGGAGFQAGLEAESFALLDDYLVDRVPGQSDARTSPQGPAPTSTFTCWLSFRVTCSRILAAAHSDWKLHQVPRGISERLTTERAAVALAGS